MFNNVIRISMRNQEMGSLIFLHTVAEICCCFQSELCKVKFRSVAVTRCCLANMLWEMWENTTNAKRFVACFDRVFHSWNSRTCRLALSCTPADSTTRYLLNKTISGDLSHSRVTMRHHFLPKASHYPHTTIFCAVSRPTSIHSMSVANEKVRTIQNLIWKQIIAIRGDSLYIN